MGKDSEVGGKLVAGTHPGKYGMACRVSSLAGRGIEGGVGHYGMIVILFRSTHIALKRLQLAST